VSGLVSLLTGDAPLGVHRWESAREVDEIRHTVELAEWRLAHFDGWVGAGERRAVLRGIGDALAFGDHYGVNYDALADCLSDVPGRTLLLWDGWSVLARADERAFEVIVSILAERCEDDRAPFSVLLRGEGPEISVPVLG
jgi:RNAse (barnase) inhibitor barstar